MIKIDACMSNMNIKHKLSVTSNVLFNSKQNIKKKRKNLKRNRKRREDKKTYARHEHRQKMILITQKKVATK